MNSSERNRSFILNAHQNGVSTGRIARQLYFLRTPHVFEGLEDMQLNLYEEICAYAKVPLSAVKIIGSAHTGFSLTKNTPFDPKSSDLDVAIIDKHLYIYFFEKLYIETNHWSDINKFGNDINAQRRNEVFMRHLEKGIINISCMPSIPEKSNWTNFFGKLSSKHSSYYNNINAFIYATDLFLVEKQKSALSQFIINKDKI